MWSVAICNSCQKLAAEQPVLARGATPSANFDQLATKPASTGWSAGLQKRKGASSHFATSVRCLAAKVRIVSFNSTTDRTKTMLSSYAVP